MMDEQLIDEVAHHGVIYNRQKYYLNGSSSGGKYETKDEAWTIIALKLRTDVETCKKRWKYLRERYVSQRKQGDPPVYEHLSRPYLEKMKFLDQHIQPRKSYRNVPNFLTSPQSANSSNYSEYNVDSKSNSSHKNMSHFGGTGQNHHYHQHQHQSDHHAMNALNTAAASALENGQVKIEAEIFRDFAAAVASQQLHLSQSQMQQQQAAAVAAVMADSSQGYQEPYRDNNMGVSAAQNSAGSTGGLTSTSSSMKSPLSSPIAGITVPNEQSTPIVQQPPVHSSSNGEGAGSNTGMQGQAPAYNQKMNDDMHSSSSSYYNKKPRVQLNSNGNSHAHHSNNGMGNGHFSQDSDDDSDDNSNELLKPQAMMQHDNHYGSSMNMQRNANSGNNTNNSGSSNQQQPQQQQQQQQQQHQNMFPANTDFLFQLYQQLPQQAGGSHATNFGKFQTPNNAPSMQRSSEHLLGELVTTELLKMNKDRRKNVQKRILEILFFDD
ncbi:CG7745 [Drosophila busckii]|uniref:CG7745 n=1 Tax=Drosophila busckii TaxID=30019 RepID=A0A0M4EJK1_DROBS|nr:probable serine/threonine-protein kinase DDB_G0282963 [Drosophila busckii]ALC41442.1 CG7745 [Drosophila busckii]